MTTFQLTDDDINFDSVATDTDNDGKRECSDCGKRYSVTKSGEIRAHNCNGVKTVATKKTNTPSNKAKRSKNVPASVMKIGTAALASGIEWTTTSYISSFVPCDKAEIPASVTDIPDADTMIGPLVELLWPTIPAKAQAFVKAICDEEKLIMAALSWWDYLRGINKFAEAAHKIRKQEKDANNGIQKTLANDDGGIGKLYAIEPFATGATS